MCMLGNLSCGIFFNWDVTHHSYSTNYISAPTNDNVVVFLYHRQGLILQNTIKYSDNVLCLFHLCQINNWHNILVRFVIFIRMQRYILKCAILSTYGQLNNNHKQFRSKLGSNSFIWYITTINIILLEACG